MLETIYIARHGFRLSWETSVWNAPTGTPRDPPLSAHGVDQAKELALWLKTLPDDQRPEAIYSSPLYRCLQTATPVAEALGQEIRVEHGLAEWYLPVRRGLHPRSLPASELIEWIPLISPTSHSSLLYPSQKGETVDELHTRTTRTLTLLTNHVNSLPNPPKRIILFSHAATTIAMGHSLIDDGDKFIRAATCSVSKYTLVEGSRRDRDGLGRWSMEMNGDTAFLKGGEERHWDFSFVEAYEEDGVLEDGTDLPLESDKYKTANTIDPSSVGTGKGSAAGGGKL